MRGLHLGLSAIKSTLSGLLVSAVAVFTVKSSAGANYTTTRVVKSSAGTNYTVPRAVLSSAGTPYNVI